MLGHTGEVAASSSSSHALQAHPSNIETVGVILARVKRSGAEYQLSLLDVPELVECHDRLRAADLLTELDTGTTIFLEPDHVQPTLECLRTQGVMLGGKHLFLEDLRAWHIIAGSRYFAIVEDAVSHVERRLQVKISKSQKFSLQVPHLDDPANHTAASSERPPDDLTKHPTTSESAPCPGPDVREFFTQS